jgi:hypothetical protein
MKHISASIEGLLNLTDKKLNTVFLTDGRQARKELEMQLLKGNNYIRSEGCDNFDSKEGCKCK